MNAVAVSDPNEDDLIVELWNQQELVGIVRGDSQENFEIELLNASQGMSWRVLLSEFEEVLEIAKKKLATR